MTLGNDFQKLTTHKFLFMDTQFYLFIFGEQGIKDTICQSRQTREYSCDLLSLHV